MPILIVSGLPRSGTSLLMRMLAAGGVEPFTDGRRAADDDNPHGYFELEAVKRLKEDSSWVPEARGKSLKVISHLLENLPAGERYRVFFVERDLDEVLASQATMIRRRGGVAPSQEAVRRAFEAHLSAFDGLATRRGDLVVLRVRYPEIVAAPGDMARAIAEFVAEGGLPRPDAEAMARAVDPSLYRNRGRL